MTATWLLLLITQSNIYIYIYIASTKKALRFLLGGLENFQNLTITTGSFQRMVNSNRPKFPSWLVRHQRTHEAFLSPKKQAVKQWTKTRAQTRDATWLISMHIFLIPEGTWTVQKIAGEWVHVFPVGPHLSLRSDESQCVSPWDMKM